MSDRLLVQDAHIKQKQTIVPSVGPNSRAAVPSASALPAEVSICVNAACFICAAAANSLILCRFETTWHWEPLTCCWVSVSSAAGGKAEAKLSCPKWANVIQTNMFFKQT